jgi:hypothetical protein
MSRGIRNAKLGNLSQSSLHRKLFWQRKPSEQPALPSIWTLELKPHSVEAIKLLPL